MPADITHDAQSQKIVEADSLKILESVQQRVLWLATRMVDHANRERETPSGLKVGGHQASSASMVSIMTALWFHHLEAEDRVSVKPHASPVLHAAHYLLGELDGSYLTRLREAGGLQAYPSRTKDPDRVDFSTGSVGLGAAAPLFGALTRRYVDAHFGDRGAARFISLLGDAELDEGNVWEAVADPATGGLGNVMWVVDFNRQSLDRIVPGVRIHQWRAQFEAAGWHVVEVKYGRLLTEFLARPGNEAVRDWLDAMPNEQYQSLFTLPPDQARVRFLDGAGASVVDAVADVDDAALFTLVTDLGGHDLVSLLEAFAHCDAESGRPSVVFAYTIKGWGLPIAGNARNHSALLSGEQIDALRERCGLTAQTEWDHFDAVSPEGIWCNARRDRLRRAPASPNLAITVPVESPGGHTRPASTQEIFGRVLVDLSRDEQVRPYLVSTAPDVATSTNLAGLINRLGVFNPAPQRSWSEDPVLKWNQSPAGHHIELGISEMNLFLLLGQLGLAWDHARQPLIPIGTVYDPFVLRGLDALIYSVYSGARFIVAGTPSGVTLAAEGGAHQSTITPSVGIELPGLTFLEPAYGRALDWLLRDAVTRLARGDDTPQTAAPKDDGAYYFRLTTRVIDQAPFEAAKERLGAAVLRRQVLAGGYRLVDAYELAPALKAQQAPTVTLVGTGAVMPEVLAAAAELLDEGVAAHVVDITSADRLYTAWQRTLRQGIRTATTPSVAGALRGAFGDVRTPVVSVHDGASHSLAWLGSALGVACVPLGVDSFGQSGDIGDLYRLHDLTPGSIVNAALAALDLSQ